MYAAINNAGEVLVDQLKPARAFVWHDGVTTNLPETIDSFSGMNNSGQFVGYINLPPPNHSLHHAILWDAKHGVLDLGAIGGEWRVFARRADWSEARAVNNRGQVVGTSSIKLGDSATQSGHAFLWEKGAMIDLGAPEGTVSSAEAINASGEVVGEILFGDSESRGFIWKRGTGMTTLGTLGGVRSAAHDINDAGDVVGDSQTVQGYFHPFLLHQGGNMADLCTLGGRDAVATAINNAGQVVGWSEINWGDKKERHAFLWNRGKMIDLSVLPGVKAAGWAELTVGWGINDQGQIVGYGVRDGRPQVFFLTLDPTSSQVR
jgi:probable HAF family extracellular repeat protein